MIARSTSPHPPSFTVLQESNRFPIRDGWIWNECLVRLSDGTVAWYDMPVRPIGSAA